jgi:transglutaminase-like putative cysteine protease
MALQIETWLAYDYTEPTDLLLQIEAALVPDQRLIEHGIGISPVEHFARMPGHDEIGERIWLRVGTGELRVDYHALVEVNRPVADIAALPYTDPHLLPGQVIDYLMPSRFCPSDLFGSFVSTEFAGLSGGACVAAMRDWIAANFSYVPGVSHASTSAADSFLVRQGVCRDYAHVLVSMARAASIPARYASVYAPDVDPPDFHAVAEVWLAGDWHLVDATGMARPDEIARIGVGRDAADSSFLSSFGIAQLVNQEVKVTRV